MLANRTHHRDKLAFELAEEFEDRCCGHTLIGVVDVRISHVLVRRKIGGIFPAEIERRDDRTLKDSTGKAFGQELFAAGQKPEGQISEVGYLFPKPGPDKTPVPKVSFVTRVGDIYCGVGYYK